MASVDYSGLTEHLPSLSFEAPLTEEEKVFSKKLRLRCWAQTLCGCAHAAFYCKLLTAIRCRVLDESCFHHSWMSKFLILRIDSGSLRIGVLGCGVLGKQLVLALLQLSDLTPANITVSTRRPENLSELTKLGVKCIYDNKRMAASVDVMFLCCLPSHLITVSSQIRGCMSESCIVYSFVTAVPVLRLKHLLAHSTIVRPQYSHCGDPWVKLWESHKNALGALLDQEVIEVSSPFKESVPQKAWKHWENQLCLRAKALSMQHVRNHYHIRAHSHGSTCRPCHRMTHPSQGSSGYILACSITSASYTACPC
uniref:NADP-dependent oxidoreductase domain-containing protein 1 isoform X2 n=1 Tax=Pristiophorus japonicus TaxID=55135 RepID=UPI00398F76B5